MSTYKIIGNEMSKNLLIKRRQQNITLAEMAKQVNVTRDVLSQIERGRKQVVQARVFNSLNDWLLQEEKK
ncbi:helix-turn-helix domain-containing protein [Leuconostoc lactis]|uniref:helix-turn-helix domain-containing protein n=1 Tax=Leuconostoc lactis TaxID=1246 RepID=UPI0025AF4776|nr:helix-turn-helix transcriptional regulator [Leuconostoc lactis]MDN2649643.1 helix-turn-helix transcriptional regulator [Leuconostoc lactis]